MFTKIAKFVSGNFGANHKLIKAIREDSHKNWENHFNDFNKVTTSKANPLALKWLGEEIYENNLRQCLANLRITDDKRQLLEVIQKYFQLSESQVTLLKRKFATKAVDLLSKYRMQKLSLLDIEEYEIQLLGSELKMTKLEIDKIVQSNAIELFQKFASDKLALGHPSDVELQEIQNAAISLKLSPTNLPLDTKTKAQFDYAILLNDIQKGNMPNVINSLIILQKDEIAHWQIGATLLTPKVITTGYESRSSGVSIRVMKGMSYRIGSSRSRPMRQAVTIRNTGNLIITNKRIVFTGPEKSFSIGFKQLLSFDPYSDGIGLQKITGNGYILELTNFQSSELTCLILERSINIFFA